MASSTLLAPSAAVDVTLRRNYRTTYDIRCVMGVYGHIAFDATDCAGGVIDTFATCSIDLLTHSVADAAHRTETCSEPVLPRVTAEALR